MNIISNIPQKEENNLSLAGEEVDLTGTILPIDANTLGGKSLSQIKNELTPLLPSGIILMWSGAITNIPNGWVLCNGENGTPDLRDRFIVGAGSDYSVGNIGGEASVTLNTEQMPSHTHTLSLSNLKISSNGSHTHDVPKAASGGTSSGSVLAPSGSRTGTSAVTEESGNHTHSISGSGTINDTGGGQAHENRPPYYALYYIMKT